jgi:hypothetical protein
MEFGTVCFTATNSETLVMNVSAVRKRIYKRVTLNIHSQYIWHNPDTELTSSIKKILSWEANSSSVAQKMQDIS